MEYQGSCHCGVIQVTLTLSWSAGEAPVRACECSFCRAHGARTVTDPQGRAEIRFRDPDKVNHYRFGLRTADFLICKACGVYVAAVALTETGPKATVNVNALEDGPAFDPSPPGVGYDGETAQRRLERRERRWTPAKLHE